MDAGSGSEDKAYVTSRSQQLSPSIARVIEAEVVDRFASWATSSGRGSRRSGRASSKAIMSSADMARSASVEVRGRGGSLGAVTPPTPEGIDTDAAGQCRT